MVILQYLFKSNSHIVFRFLQGEGLQLMNLMLREKKKSRSGALRYKSYNRGILGNALDKKIGATHYQFIMHS